MINSFTKFQMVYIILELYKQVPNLHIPRQVSFRDNVKLWLYLLIIFYARVTAILMTFWVCGLNMFEKRVPDQIFSVPNPDLSAQKWYV